VSPRYRSRYYTPGERHVSACPTSWWTDLLLSNLDQGDPISSGSGSTQDDCPAGTPLLTGTDNLSIVGLEDRHACLRDRGAQTSLTTLSLQILVAGIGTSRHPTSYALVQPSVSRA
jgi:hypothetical protein